MIYVLRYLLVVLYTLFWGSVAGVVGLVDRGGEFMVWAARVWARWILKSCGVEVEARGLENLDPAQPYVLMSNHQSAVDIAALATTLPVSFRFAAKRELTWIPVFGWCLVIGRHVIIDRRSRQQAVQSLERAAQRIRKGTNVIIFPEGTRSATGRLGEFKSGGFHLAIAARAPILPVTVSGSRRIAPKGSLRIESGRVGVRYGKPIPTEQLTIDDRAELKQQVRESILSGFDPELQDVVADRS